MIVRFFVGGMDRRKCSKRIFFMITAIVGTIAVIFIGIKIYLQVEKDLKDLGNVLWEERDLREEDINIQVLLKDKEVTVYRDDKLIWESEAGVKVADVVIDRDGSIAGKSDGNPDELCSLILFCYKKGRYGRHKPFWVEDDETVWSSHIYIYGIYGNEVRPKWMASDIGIDARKIGCEKGYLYIVDSAEEKSYWRWDGWGLKRFDPAVHFLAAGDNIIHKPILKMASEEGMRFDFAYEEIRDLIKEYDLAAVVQETPLVTEKSMYGFYPHFGTPKELAESLSRSGFDIAVCATNHMMDRGDEGVRITEEAFSEQDMICVGIQNPADAEYFPYKTVSKKGIKFALLDYTYGLNDKTISSAAPFSVHLLSNEEGVREDIKRARREADAVIVFVHWGDEYKSEISDFQRKWANIFSQEGVDLVVGSHPHVVQKSEMLKNKNGKETLIYYSLGNFLSSQTDDDTKRGILADVTFMNDENGIVIESYASIDIEDVYENERVRVKIK